MGGATARANTQRDSRVWYRLSLPDKNYRNVEGIDWLSDDTLIAVSDRMKTGQPPSARRRIRASTCFRIREVASQPPGVLQFDQQLVRLQLPSVQQGAHVMVVDHK
jgi:hypothetical protein